MNTGTQSVGRMIELSPRTRAQKQPSMPARRNARRNGPRPEQNFTGNCLKANPRCLHIPSPFLSDRCLAELKGAPVYIDLGSPLPSRPAPLDSKECRRVGPPSDGGGVDRLEAYSRPRSPLFVEVLKSFFVDHLRTVVWKPTISDCRLSRRPTLALFRLTI